MGFLAYNLYYAPFMKNLALWVFGVLVIYWFSVSGGMHNIIRGVPMYYPDQNGQVKVCRSVAPMCTMMCTMADLLRLFSAPLHTAWLLTFGHALDVCACKPVIHDKHPTYMISHALQVFMPSNQGQLGAEGFIMGSMYLGFGLCVAALTFAVPKLASESGRRYAAYACIFSAVMIFRQIVSLYTWKTGASPLPCPAQMHSSGLLSPCSGLWLRHCIILCRLPVAHILLSEHV